MAKFCYLLLFICFSCVCFAQRPDAYYGKILTMITANGTEADTSQLLYCRNNANDRLSVYTVRNGLVSDATAYQLTKAKNGLYLYTRSLRPGQQIKDSLHVGFNDIAHVVVINTTDRYLLFPQSYALFKQQVKAKHSIMALLNLLSDAVGDYPISDMLPLLNYTPQLNKQVIQAKIVTQRSQADMKDTWTCNYYYNKDHQLDSVSAANSEEIRYRKKVNYSRLHVKSINTYLNVEDRQVTDRTIRYDNSNLNTIKCQERVNELGKNRETTLLVSLKSRDIRMMRKIEPSTAEVIELLKPTKNHGYNKKYIN
jgi:hypothetical protein